MDLYFLIFVIASAQARIFCGKTKMPLEVGEWEHNLKHMDSAIVENHPVSISEGQIYVYDNYFPGYTIKYIHVDNLAIKTCGASATIRDGGMDTSSVLIVLHAEANQEIRSVVDIWGTKMKNVMKPIKPAFFPNVILKSVRSRYLFKELRAVNHNTGTG